MFCVLFTNMGIQLWQWLIRSKLVSFIKLNYWTCTQSNSLLQIFKIDTKIFCYKYKNVRSLKEVDLRYATICYWWYSSKATSEEPIHELNNWLVFLHFCVHQWGRFMLGCKISLHRSFDWQQSFMFYTYFILSIWMQKIPLEEEANMPTCNLSKIVHNVWFQQSTKRRDFLYVATSNDYVRAFK
jgi:hypothetical protein